MPNHFSRHAVKNRDREQRKPNYKQASYRSAVKGDAQRPCPRVTCRLRRADVCQHRDAHADVTSCERTKRADDKPNCRRMVFKDEEENKNDDGDQADRDDLTLQIGLGSFLNGGGDFPHPFVAR